MSESLQFRQLTSAEDRHFSLVCQWQYDWWGAEFALTPAQVALYMRHSLCPDRVPYTFVAERAAGQLVGYYQVVPNDLFTRPDLGPWFGFALIGAEFRGRGYFRQLMNQVPNHARTKGLRQLYLHTRHTGLYEKFGWELIAESDQFKPDGITRRIYRLTVPGV